MLWLLFVAMLTISYCLNSWLPTMLVDVGLDETFAALSVSIFWLRRHRRRARASGC